MYAINNRYSQQKPVGAARKAVAISLAVSAMILALFSTACGPSADAAVAGGKASGGSSGGTSGSSSSARTIASGATITVTTIDSMSSRRNTVGNPLNAVVSFDLRYHPTGEPTGRPMFPGFVARSRSDPASELHSATEWKALWEDARSRILGKPMPKLYRWNTEAEFCA